MVDMLNLIPNIDIVDVDVETAEAGEDVSWRIDRASTPHEERVVVRVHNQGDHSVTVVGVHVRLTMHAPSHARVTLLELGLQSTDIDVGVVELGVSESYCAEHAGILSLDGDSHAVIGFATSVRFLTSVNMSRSQNSIALTATCLTESVVLAPGQSLESETLVIVADRSAQRALSIYGDACAELMTAFLRFDQPPTGWLSWYCFYGTVSEQDVLRQLEALATDFTRSRPEYVVIDSGWFSDTGWGDWEPNDKFPHGMRWLADRIRDAGFKPGLWFSPLLVSATSRLAHDRPDLLLRDDAGLPVPTMGTELWDRMHPGRDSGSAPLIDIVDEAAIRFALDLGSDAVHEWLSDLFARVRHDWGYEFIKLDFLVRAMITDRGRSPHRPGRGHDLVVHSGATTVEAYRRAMATIRDSVGDDCFVLGCAAPLIASAGRLIDANRMTPDITRRNYGDEPAPDRPTSWDLVVMCSRSLATRHFLNRRIGWNDPDVLVARDRPIPGISDSFTPTLDEARVWATVVALSAGVTMLGDDLARLEPERRAVAFPAFPPLAEAVVPWDLFTSPVPTIWPTRVVMPGGGQRALVAVFNWADHDADVSVPASALGSIGIDIAEGCVTVDLWTGSVTEHADGLSTRLPPHSVQWLWVTEPPLNPGLVGATIREFDSVDAHSSTGSELVMKPSLGDAAEGELVIYVPEGFTVQEAEFDRVTEHCIRVGVRSDESVTLVFDRRV
jgi:alpha-galactosidase